jgi:hypothetical protein
MLPTKQYIEQYSKLKQIIQKANPKKEWVETFVSHGEEYDDDTPITIADVLSACTPDEQPVTVDGSGVFTSYKADIDGKTPVVDRQSEWNLLDDNLDNQSDETKQFLINLLV